MSLVVNHNMMAANVARNLNAHYGNLSTSTQRLSTGMRINSAADDAEPQKRNSDFLHISPISFVSPPKRKTICKSLAISVVHHLQAFQRKRAVAFVDDVGFNLLHEF